MKLYKVDIYKQELFPKQKTLKNFNRGVIYRKKAEVNSLTTSFSRANFQMFLHF